VFAPSGVCLPERLRYPRASHLWHVTANVCGYGGAQQKKRHAKSENQGNLPHRWLPCLRIKSPSEPEVPMGVWRDRRRLADAAPERALPDDHARERRSGRVEAVFVGGAAVSLAASSRAAWRPYSLAISPSTRRVRSLVVSDACVWQRRSSNRNGE